MSWFRLKACPKCRGDLASDDGDWICLQCGTYYYTGLYDYTGLSRAKGPRSEPEAGIRLNGQLISQTEQGSRNGPDYPPRRQEKALVWGLGVTPVMAGAANRVAVATANLIPSVELAVDLAMRQQ